MIDAGDEMSDTPTVEFEAAFQERAGQNEADPAGGPQIEAGAADGAARTDDQQGSAAETPPPDGKAEPVTTPDIWANATEDQRSAFQAEQEARAAAEHRWKSDQGRVTAYQRDLHDLRRQLKTVTTSVSAQDDPIAFLQSEGWQKAKADYDGDLGEVFSAIEKLGNHVKARDDGMGKLDQALTNSDYVANQRMFDEGAPGWQDLLAGADGGQTFMGWLSTQAPMYRDAYERNREAVTDPASAVEVVNRYRAHVEKTAAPSQSPTPTPTPQLDPKRAAQLDGARTFDSKSPPVGDSADNFDGFFGQRAAQLEHKHNARR